MWLQVGTSAPLSSPLRSPLSALTLFKLCPSIEEAWASERPIGLFMDIGGMPGRNGVDFWNPRVSPFISPIARSEILLGWLI